VKIFTKTLIITSIAVYLAAAIGCGPSTQKPQTEPQVTPKEPTIEELRKPVAKDPTIYKAAEVLKEYGRFTKKYMSYEKYQQSTGGQGAAALDPDWFYDSYVLDLNENNYWATVTFGTAKRAFERDPRIQELMKDLPETSIFMKLKTPSGRTYMLVDAEADGILDFVKDARQKKVEKVDIELLDKMQEKYTWIIGLVKKHYKR
jgi:hypothetical protein